MRVKCAQFITDIMRFNNNEIMMHDNCKRTKHIQKILSFLLKSRIT